jgi:hypothetical protein
MPDEDIPVIDDDEQDADQQAEEVNPAEDPETDQLGEPDEDDQEAIDQ